VAAGPGLAEPVDIGEQVGLLVDPGPGHAGGVGDAADGDGLAAAGRVRRAARARRRVWSWRVRAAWRRWSVIGVPGLAG
jgi:hypothetical protein